MLIYPLIQGTISEKFSPWTFSNPDVGAERAFRVAKEWLSECHSSHLQCRFEDTEFRPTRLLKVIPVTADGMVRLVHSKVCLKGTIIWCALSCVWGGEQPFKTTKSTLECNSNGILLSSLSPALQDAVTVCRAFQISWLWVDSLCIVQDDPEDVATELVAMSRIYSQAYLTISAACSKTVRKGFLCDRPIHFRNVQPIVLQYQK
jgi:hypothetical protein